MRTEYLDPSFVSECFNAIMWSSASHIPYIVQKTGDRSYYTHPQNGEIPATCFCFIGTVCEEWVEGKPIRRSIFTPVGFSCVWEDMP